MSSPNRASIGDGPLATAKITHLGDESGPLVWYKAVLATWGASKEVMRTRMRSAVGRDDPTLET